MADPFEPMTIATKGRWDLVISDRSASQIDLIPNKDIVAHELGGDCICGPTLELKRAKLGFDRWLYNHHALEKVPIARDR